MDVLLPIYHYMFHILFESGEIPVDWTRGMIVAVSKSKWDVMEHSNYRAIIVVSYLDKFLQAL